MTKCLPGSWITLRGTTARAIPSLKGTIIKDRMVPFEIYDDSGSLIFKGKLQDRVARSSSTRKLCFEHIIRETQTGLPGEITIVKRTNFTGFLTDIEFRTDGADSVGPTGATRYNDGSPKTFFLTDNPI